LRAIVSATLLNAPADLQADAKGMHQLSNIMAATGPYQGVVAVVRKPWLDQNLPLATSFVRAMVASLKWMYDPANTAEAAAMLSDAAKVPLPVATTLLPVIIAARGAGPVGMVDPAAIKTVLALRSRFGLPQKTLTDVTRYYDNRAYRAATGTS